MSLLLRGLDVLTSKDRSNQREAQATSRAEAGEGAPLGWFYDPPWTMPFLRLNEVAVTVERR